jgi:DNA-binding transcriptional MocR family regulator
MFPCEHARARGGSLALAIKRGDYQPGRKIPSEATLMQEHDLARETARKAVRVLADEGWSKSSKAAASTSPSGPSGVAQTFGLIAPALSSLTCGNAEACYRIAAAQAADLRPSV